MNNDPGIYRAGDVFQINTNLSEPRAGWVGAFVMATEIKEWGIQGFVPHVESHHEQSRLFIRLKWAEIDYIGRAVLMPQEQPLTP